MSSVGLYVRVCAKRGSQLRRIGATDHCIVCGMPALPGVAAFAHIHMRDLVLSPAGDPTRVFCLRWHHHHGCYDQGYISTMKLLQAEAIWIENKRRPNKITSTRHRFDEASERKHHRSPLHLDRGAGRAATDFPFYPISPFLSDPNVLGHYGG
jgi:hypothetical protein